jgi:signal peptidase I
VTVPRGQYWVIGDNRSNTTGSHIFGPVPRHNIVGRVWITYWPRSDWGFSPKYSAGPVPATG